MTIGRVLLQRGSDFSSDQPTEFQLSDIPMSASKLALAMIALSRLRPFGSPGASLAWLRPMLAYQERFLRALCLLGLEMSMIACSIFLEFQTSATDRLLLY